jgi:2-methylisocitrate lyase-like PEP mutase family enzyme
MPLPNQGRKLRELFARKGKVLSVFGIPNALHAKVMDAAGIECGFVGGAGTAGNYTGFSNTSMTTMTELVQIGGYIARSVSFPIILDGDTGPGSLTAIERLVEDCIRAGIACLRFEDQRPGMKHQGQGQIEVIPRDLAVARYRVAAAARDRLDPDFVIGAKTYARNANGGGLQEGIDRLNLYREAGCDTVHFQSAHSIDEVREIRAKVEGVIACVQAPPMSLELHEEIGLDIAWFTSELSTLLQVASWEYLNTFQKVGTAAWDRFVAEHGEALAEVRRLDLLGAQRQDELEAEFLGDS